VCVIMLPYSYSAFVTDTEELWTILSVVVRKIKQENVIWQLSQLSLEEKEKAKVNWFDHHQDGCVRALNLWKGRDLSGLTV